MDVKTTFRNLVRDQSVSICMLQYIYINFFLGFFNYKNKKYGAFFCAVQTFSKTVFAIPIKDLKSDTLIKALEAMSKVLFIISPSP